MAWARSPQRASVVMPCDVLVKELAPIGLLNSAVYPELRLDVRKRTLQHIVGVGIPRLGLSYAVHR